MAEQRGQFVDVFEHLGAHGQVCPPALAGLEFGFRQ
jgi:hypothetical protein